MKPFLLCNLAKLIICTYSKASVNNPSINGDNEKSETSIVKTSFNMLSVDIPPAPLFRDSQGATVIPQIPLFQLLKKFDGSTWSDKMTDSGPVRKRYILKKLPNFLILHLARFEKSGFTFAEEKNSMIVTFPVRNLEMKDYVVLDNLPNIPLIESLTGE
jgi:U4/U6.U5 tri-snRNP-associated protein 2